MIEPNSKWEAVVMRCVSEAQTVLRNNQSDGIAIVTMHMIVSYNGEPLLWVVPAARRVEPSKDAQQVVAELVANLSKD